MPDLEQRVASLEKLISLMRPWLRGPLHGMPLKYYNMKVTEVAEAHTASSDNMLILCDATSAAFTVTLPPVAEAYERVVAIKKVDASANAVTVDGSGGETIDGSATKSLAGQYRWIMLVCGDTEWHIVNNSESMTVAITGIPYAAPGLTLGTSNVEGSTNNVLRTDATVLAFDATSPTTIQPDNSAAAGSATVAARRDHQHAVVAATAGSITPDASAAEGSASSFARSDHAHGIVAATAGNQAIGDSAGEGDATSFARSNHVHGMPSFAPPGLTLGTSNVEGAATTLLRSDATVLAFDATNPAQLTPDVTAAVGVATVAARRDHVHNVPAAAPSANLTVSTTNAEGSAGDFGRSDHAHAITSSANPGAAASLLASAASGLLQLVGLGIGAAAAVSQIVLPSAGKITTDAGDLELTPAGDLILDPQGNDVLPETNHDINLGSWLRKYLTLHCAELHVGTLVAEDILATIGGRILVGPTTTLTTDLGSGDTTIYVEHNNLAENDTVLLEGNGNIEYVLITQAPQGAGPYSHTCTRNRDGSGANNWVIGDAVFNTGTTGDGFMELHSDTSLLGDAGPALVGWKRTSTTYNALTEVFSLGELNGLYGYGAANMGLGLGIFGDDWVTLEPTGGLKFYNNNLNTLWLDASGNVKIGSNVTAAATTALTIDAALGDLLIGAIGAGQANIFWDRSEGKLKFRGNTTMGVEIDTDGTLLAGAGDVKLDANGIAVAASTVYANLNAYKFLDSSANLTSAFQSYVDATKNYSRLSMPGIAGKLSSFAVEVTSPTGEAGATVGLHAATQNQSASMILAGDETNGLDYVRFDTDRFHIWGGGLVISDTATAAFIPGQNTINVQERSSDPTDPVEGNGILWLSNGTGTGNDGDLIFERTAGGVTAASVVNGLVFTPGYYTSTDWDGDAKNGNTIIDLSAAFGLPAGVKAVSLQLAIIDETPAVYGRLSQTSALLNTGVLCRTQVANQYIDVAGIVLCDANGDIYWNQGGELDGVNIYVSGYWS